jgi:hypothetical protein
MAPLKQRSDEIDEDAPTTVFVRGARAPARPSHLTERQARLMLAPNDARGRSSASR